LAAVANKNRERLAIHIPAAPWKLVSERCHEWWWPTGTALHTASSPMITALEDITSSWGSLPPPGSDGTGRGSRPCRLGGPESFALPLWQVTSMHWQSWPKRARRRRHLRRPTECGRPVRGDNRASQGRRLAPGGEKPVWLVAPFVPFVDELRGHSGSRAVKWMFS
jgi:hypothetical protein